MADGTPPGVGHELTITRSFAAPRDVVFDCFTDPARFARWWGPAQCRNEIHALDAHPGGKISLRMSGPSFDHVMGGEFVDIERPRRLVFLAKAFEVPGGGWGLINRNTLTFEDEAGGTKLTLHVRVEQAEGELVLAALGGLEAGWRQSLGRLGDLLATV